MAVAGRRGRRGRRGAVRRPGHDRGADLVRPAADPRLHRRRPHGRYPYTTHRDEGVVRVLDTTSLQVVSSNPIDVGPPRSVTFSPDGSRAYVTVLDEAAVRVHDLAA